MNLKFIKNINYSPIIFFLIALSLLIGTIGFLRLNFFENVEYGFFDKNLYSTHVKQQQEDIAYIRVTDSTLQNIGNWPFDRKIHAKLLLDNLTDAKAVVFDMLFADKTNSDSDKTFADAIKKSGNVILDYIDKTPVTPSLMPLDMFLSSCNRAGFVNDLQLDSDNLTRKFILQRTHDNKRYPSIVYAILKECGYDVNIDNNNLIVKKDEKIISSFKLKSNDTFYRIPMDDNLAEIYNYEDVLNGMYPPNEFKNKIVIIGNSFTGSSDTIPTPIINIIGMKYIGDSLKTVLSGLNPERVNVFLECLILIIIILSISILAQKFPIRFSVFIIVAFCFLTIYINRILLVDFMIWHETLYSLIAILFSYTFTIIILYVQKQREIKIDQIPLDAILHLNSKHMVKITFEEYLNDINKDVMSSSFLELREVCIGQGHELYEKYLEKNTEMNEIFSVDNYVFIPLSSFDELGKFQYCVLKSTKKSNKNNIKHVCALVLSADAFFKSIKVHQENSRLFKSTIESMIAGIDSKDPVTSGHSKRVADLSYDIGTWLGFSDDALETLRFAAVIHDIGKLGVSDFVLNKPNFLSEAEFNEVKAHPLNGGAIIESIKMPDEIRTAVLQHHERPDGKGYPLGLTAEQISPTARIIKVADVFDALISTRQYKKVWELERVCQLLYDGRGTEFDADIVDITLKHLAPKNWIPDDKPAVRSRLYPPFFCKTSNDILANFTSIDEDVFDKNPLDINFDLKCTHSKFAGMEFGDPLNKKEFLYSVPTSVFIDKESDSVYYYKENKNSINKICYVFIRGFLSAGLVACSKESKKREFYNSILLKLGEPTFIENGNSVWDLRSCFAVLYKNSNMELSDYIVYVNKSISY